MNPLTNKAFSSFHNTAVRPLDIEATVDSTLPTQPSSSLVILSPKFELNQKEESLLKAIIHKRKLTLNLTLFDLLFFDLHEELTALRNCVRSEDFDKQILELEGIYTALCVDEKKETTPLREFLEKIVKEFITSNKLLNTPDAESDHKIKMRGECKLIYQTLLDRVELFKKIEKAPEFHPQLFCEPLSRLLGIEKFPFIDTIQMRVIFENSSVFLSIVFNSALRKNPKLRDHSVNFLGFIQAVQSMGDLTSNRLIKENNLMSRMGNLPVLKELSPHLFKICMESIAVFDAILKEAENFHQSIDNEKNDLAFQIGKTPSMRGEIQGFLDPKDMLAQFKAQNLVDSHFQLSSEESTLLQELFCYPLDSNMTLLDILGFALYDRLENLKGIIPKFDSRIVETQTWISIYCISLLAGFSRLQPKSLQSRLGAVNAYSEKFTIFPHTFPDKINKLLSDFEVELIKYPSNSKRKEIFKKFNGTIVPVKNLFLKLLQSKENFFLFLKAASTYQRHESLDKKNRLGRETVKRYWEYFKIGSQMGKKKRAFSVSIIFNKIINDWDISFSMPVNKREMNEFGQNIIQQIQKLSQTLRVYQSEYLEVLNGNLDHASWLKRHDVPIVEEKNPSEFKEKIFADMSNLRTHLIFLNDILRLVEKRVYPEGTLTTESCFFRLRQNMTKVKQSMNCIASDVLSESFTEKFASILNPIMNEFENYSKLFKYALYHLDIQNGDFVYSRWLKYLIPLETSISSLLKSSLHSLMKLKIELLIDLRNQWSTFSDDEFQKIDVKKTQEAIFQEGLKLLRPLLILTDMLALLQKRRYAEEAAIIPKELADIMELDGIEEIFQKLTAEKLPLLVASVEGPVKNEKGVENSVIVVEEHGDKIDPGPTLLRPEKKKNLKQIAAVEKRRETPPVVEAQISPYEEEIHDLAQMKKSRLILAKLFEMDFFEKRQTGSHHILEGPQGGTVVVPNNNNLPRGTANSIAEQVRNAVTKSKQESLLLQ